MTLHSADIYRFGDCRILIVDDDELNHEIVSFFLDEIGITQITSGYDGVEGLELIQRHKPDLIILDIVMPRLGGLDVLRQLRAQAAHAETPVIVLTGNDSSESRESMFNAGATDYVTKPLLAEEFQGRVKTHLKNLLLVSRLETQLENIANEMRTAAELQRSMLPPISVADAIKQKYGPSIYSLFEPSSALGGDFFGLTPLNDRAFGLYLCDFAGHGVGAALNTVRLHTMIGRLPPPDPADPAAYLAVLNDDLYEAMTNRHYATLLFGVVDVVDRTFTYASAGAPNPLLLGKGAPQWLDSRGMPLGLMQGMRYDNLQVPFGPGNQLFLYSDAMTESQTSAKAMYGAEAVAQLVADVQNQEPANRHLYHIISRFMAQVEQPLDDDLTALYINWENIS